MPITPRLSTGVSGLDGLMGGGIPRGSLVVVSGSAGTGKTILSLQFLVDGAKKGEKGLFVSVEQPRTDIIAQAKLFGWDLEKLEKQGKLKILCLPARSLFEKGLDEVIVKTIQEDGYKRLALDSITSIIFAPTSRVGASLGLSRGHMPPLAEVNRAMAASLIDSIKSLGITTMAIAQKVEGMPGETLDLVSEFRADGLLTMHYLEIGVTDFRTMAIKKLRRSDHYKELILFDITRRGIELRKSELKTKRK